MANIKLDDTTVKTFKDLKDYLGTKEELIARSFIKNLLRYSLGGELYVQDSLIIDKIIKENASTKYRVKDLLNSVIKNYFF